MFVWGGEEGITCGCSVMQFGVREVPGREADGEEEMDGGGILIISHSQGGIRAGRGAPIGVMVNFITLPPPPSLLNQRKNRKGLLPPDIRTGDS